ncbi:MAG TPA: beta-eliminating lyase-related protein [Paracoccus sp. (in: a-proteobacteria)]|uniref:threonine aldolase family protein n=1 Tax=Paracoccus sp. TaxID=267 RepID=UPI002B54958B|nr:beta-eliminating lyase-related protein [Paracoccus sp. (in: a-proteobacteria)]HWL55724.1 beta-eliminating lyase-related protein [Paracoccus sp. (in: a-proteobacteria)]
MNFASDNVHGVHPKVLKALSDCNEGAVASYGADPVTARAEAAYREILDAPEAVVRFVATGTGANALVCAQLSPSYGRIYCHDSAHLHRDECAAPEFYSHGAKLVPLPGGQGKFSPEVLDGAIRFGAAGSLNDGRNALVSITNATEWGTCYSPAEVAALARLAHQGGMKLHMDGARFANAVAGLGCAPADLGHRAGVDALCLGGTKNGALAAEAVVFFDPRDAEGFDFRRKQAGQVYSKQRYLAAQMLALAEDGLWLELARHANAMAARLGQGAVQAGGELVAPVQANEVFVRLPAEAHAHARAHGAAYHIWQDQPPAEGEPVTVRLVTSWATREDDVGRFLELLRGAA